MARSKSAIEFTSSSVEETQAFGERLGGLLRPGDAVALCGELGSGKTTLIQGIARGLGRDPNTIKSPTFVLMREYPGEIPLVHIDGYRLEGAPTIAALDLELIFDSQKITLIEWADRFEGLLPDDRIAIELSHVSTNRRHLCITTKGERSKKIASLLNTTPNSELRTPNSKDAPSRD
jgi:tRNA threonylcarbamoyladenosine biosynthesis protein TsaE